MKGIVFLDIDGVVNTPIIGASPFNTAAGKVRRPDGYYYNLCIPSDHSVSNEQSILYLNKICKEGNADIVISSTWKTDIKDTIISLYNSGLSRDIKIIGITPNVPNGVRGDEIHKFLLDNDFINKNYVILDDDSDMSICIDHLCLCNTEKGLGYHEYQEALKILKGEK